MRSLIVAVFLFTSLQAPAMATVEPAFPLPLAKIKCAPEITEVYGIPRYPGKAVINGHMYTSTFVVDPDGTATLLVKTQAAEPEVYFCTAGLM